MGIFDDLIPEKPKSKKSNFGKYFDGQKPVFSTILGNIYLIILEDEYGILSFVPVDENNFDILENEYEFICLQFQRNGWYPLFKEKDKK